MGIAGKLRRLRVVAGDWRFLPFYFQRRFRTEGARRSLGGMLAAARPRPAQPRQGRESVERAKRDLRKDGLAPLGAVLEARQCAEIRAYFESKHAFDDYRPEAGRFLPLSGKQHPHSHVGYHDAVDVARAPYLLELANRADILAAVEDFLGCRPTLSYLAVWWSYPTGLAAQQAENFHRDVDDWRFVKLFVYLTDVGEGSGPHVYVLGSAGDPRLRAIRRYEDSEVESAFGADRVTRLTGKAGEAFLENTFGLHKGQPLREGHRLMFQAVYSLLPLPYGPKRPVAARADLPAGEALDPWVNRLYLA